MAEKPLGYEYRPLEGRRIVLGLTGGVAIYRSMDLAREMIRFGAVVKPVFTPRARELVNPMLFKWATGEEPVTELTGDAEHVVLSSEWDAMVIAPSTLNTMAKIAAGIGDNPVTLTAIAFLGAGKPLLIVPTMNINLYNSPQYREIVRKLYDQGATVLPPLLVEGKAKYPPISDLVYCVDTLIERGRDMAGFKALVTAGATREYLDPVRVITNPSSGLMGIYVAREISCRGGYVTLVHGVMMHKPPYLVESIAVETTLEMAEKVKALTMEEEYDVAVYAAAPADYKPIQKAPSKIPTRLGEITMKLRPTVKVIKAVRRKPRLSIAFAAETVNSNKELVEAGYNKLSDYNVDMVVANRVGVKGRGFGSEYIDPCIVTREGSECLGVIHKALLARRIVDWVAEKLASKEGEG